MTFQLDRPLDEVDWHILRELQTDGRLSYNQLGRRVNLSSPAVAERVRRLEDAGVITGYQAKVDPARAGLPLTAFIRMRCTHGRCLLRTGRADEFPEITEIHKLSGESCAILKVRASGLRHFEGFLEKLGEHGELSTHIVLSTQYERRAVEPPPAQERPVTEATGWVDS
jgi:Lrp/AsnC family leucine-responsive transcriptional regulator